MWEGVCRQFWQVLSGGASLDAEETHGEETQIVIWNSCIDDWRCTCLTVGVCEAREFDPMIWLGLMCEEARLGNLDA